MEGSEHMSSSAPFFDDYYYTIIIVMPHHAICSPKNTHIAPLYYCAYKISCDDDGNDVDTSHLMLSPGAELLTSSRI